MIYASSLSPWTAFLNVFGCFLCLLQKLLVWYGPIKFIVTFVFYVLASSKHLQRFWSHCYSGCLPFFSYTLDCIHVTCPHSFPIVIVYLNTIPPVLKYLEQGEQKEHPWSQKFQHRSSWNKHYLLLNFWCSFTQKLRWQHLETSWSRNIYMFAKT